MMQIRISDDALAIACGANLLARAFAERGHEVVRTSSWGMHWLEPLVEIDGIGYGPVEAAHVDAILGGTADALCIGRIADHPFIASQTRLTFARAGMTRPTSLDDYAATGGWAGLERARALGAEAVVAEVTASGLRGRGGAGFPAGIKWNTVRVAPGSEKYIVCNADEGDSGTFADRMVMEGDPFMLIEGMAIAGLAVGAGKGFIYIRSEYPHAIAKMQAAVQLSSAIVAPFEVEVRVGAGAYVCGEETSLLNSLEGRRGEVRAKPPLPAHEGLFGCPTVINNVLTLAAVPFVLSQGAQAYADYGMGRSRGTMPVQIAGNVKHGGLYETAFGITLGEIVEKIGGGTASGRPIRAVQVGGPLGAYFPPALFDTPFDYEAFTAVDGLIGHGGITVFDDSADMAKQARFAFEFCAAESCGKCTPCRIGSVRGRETLDKVIAGEASEANLQLVADLCETMKFGSLCALGGFTPYPVMSAITHFPEDFGLRMAEAAE
ncbi:formate dehydrogenase iron-sulfur subunit [Novosphingobium fluoreni]|uniref:Formate dehydrogenase iron-sulfur subunit n=1 Tax=Novosphingobium fluoreni TaxID=1391222 RepID=A0A7W6C7V6_9SPHN|nr:NADH-ubiquinone oxidoreductase-F iron-sulfur binding region domain-containing protein [Novosphingobium fluoreni]MBB3941201.1 formate dehydrogenase iron-sulfur subunit [Novosphingobium fluoreni]